MIYKNSMKLLASNFNFVWKQLAYTVVRLAIIIGLTYLVSSPIIKLLQAEGYFELVADVGKTMYTDTAGVFVAIKQVFTQFFYILGQNFGQIWWAVILFFFVTLVVNSFLKSAGKYALTAVAYSTYTSQSNISYCHSLLTNSKKVMLYSLSMLVINLPFTFLKVLFICIYCWTFTNLATAIFGITMLVVVFTLTCALQLTLCKSCCVNMITSSTNPFKSFALVFTNAKDFGRVFSNAIIIVLTIIVCNFAIGLFTVGAGLIITIPASMVLAVTFQLVSHFATTKQRYYLSSNIIVDAL